MSWTDLATWLSALAAAGAFALGAWQLRLLRLDGLDARAAEIEGVALETVVVERPTRADAGAGRSRWVYRFTVHNPGRLPISDVDVVIRFPTPVERKHFDGSLEAAADHIDMHVPVILAGSSVPWTRTLLVDHDRHSQLRDTVAEVSFYTPDAGRFTTTWPARDQHGGGSPALQRLLNKRRS